MFPAVIDNSIRKAFVECPTRMMRRYVENLAPTQPNVDLHFGASFAKGIEEARRGFYEGQRVSSSEAIERGIEAAIAFYGDFQPPATSYKTKTRLIGAIRYYFEQWPLDTENLIPVEDGIEKSFALPLPFLHPDTGNILAYAGRLDMLAYCENEDNVAFYVVDEKTAGQLGDKWHLQWDMDSQMTGYIWAIKQMYPDVENVLAQIRAVSILKNDYGHTEVNITRNQWMLDRWYMQLLRDIRRMLESYEKGMWDMALGAPCSSYGRECDYARLCKSPNPERLIEGNYKTIVWNPLERK